MSYCKKYNLSKRCFCCRDCCEKFVEAWHRYYNLNQSEFCLEHLMATYEYCTKYCSSNANSIDRGKLFLCWLKDTDEKMFCRIEKLILLQ